MQRVSQEVVQALSSIGSSVSVMRETVVATAAAIEEQSAVTRDLAESMQSAAGAVTEITGNIGAIVQSVANVSHAVDTTPRRRQGSGALRSWRAEVLAR
ncbi:MAG: hypothetical protein PGN33_00105 [Methylobacterium radiotolerans]